MTIGSTSSAKRDPHPAWAQRLLPSIRRSHFHLPARAPRIQRPLGTLAWRCRNRLAHSDRAIDSRDPHYSARRSVFFRPCRTAMVCLEWLYDGLVGWLDRAAGLNGVVLFTASVIALTFSWAFHLLMRRGTNFLVALILVLLATSASMIHFSRTPARCELALDCSVLCDSGGVCHRKQTPPNSYNDRVVGRCGCFHRCSQSG